MKNKKIIAVLFLIFTSFTYSSFGIITSGRADYDFARSSVFYVQLQKYLNANYSFYFYVLPSQIQRKIYVFNYSCIGCESFNSFSKYLNSYLLNYSLGGANVTNDITNLNNSIIIIPTGRIPAFLLRKGINEPPYDIKEVFKKNNTIIYIGLDFQNAISRGNIIALTPSDLSYYSLNFTRTKIKGSFFHTNGTFVLSSGSSFDIASFSKIYFSGVGGNVSGYFVVIPSLLDSWPSPKVAAEDVAKFIFFSPWVEKVAYSNTSSFGNGIIYVFAKPLSSFRRDENFSSFLDVYIKELNSYKRVYISIPEAKSVVVSAPKSSLIFSILQMNYTIPSGMDELFPFIQIINSSGNEVWRNQLPRIPPRLENPTTFTTSIPLNIKPGEYLIFLRNINGLILGVSYFSIPNFEISLQSVDWQKNSFNFSVTSLGSPIDTTLCPICRIKNITIEKDGKTLYMYTQQNLDIKNGILTYTLPQGSILESGRYSIKISILGLSYIINVEKPVGYVLPKEVVYLIIAASVSFLLMILTKRPEVVVYAIDIPDFIPKEKEKVKVKEKSFIELFDKLNKKYHWNYMPITIEELKTICMQEIRYSGEPVVVSELNLQMILSKLEEEGKIKRVENLYMPSEWSNYYDAKYLAIFRKLRSFFVARSILFTDLGQSENDMEITYNGEKYLLTFFVCDESLKKLKLVEGSKHILVFLNEFELEDFKKKLFLSSSFEASLLRLAIFSQKVFLLAAEPSSLSQFFVS
ncbi:MAG: hypothetical protein ACPLXS_02825 [Candidatus Micrarchaeales archaeon]